MKFNFGFYMYTREIEAELRRLKKSYPVIMVIGPRQSGKTTLVRHAFPDMLYTSLEDPDVRELAESDPRSFLDQYSKGAILDEIQRVPKLLSYIQTIVDEAGLPGMFILTGSHQMELHQAISQSLAGRTALLTLLPLSLRELLEAGIDVIFKTSHQLIPIEIKSSKTYNSEFLTKLLFFQNLVGDRALKGYLIYAGTQEQKIHSIELLNYRNAFKIFA